jgi:hypothetical protein
MIVVGDRIYVANKAGTCYVIAAAPKFVQLAVNKLGEEMLSTPAFADGEIVLRTYQHLWCIREMK